MILSIIIAVVAVVGSVVMQKKMEQDMKDQQAGFLVSKSGGSNPLRIIYGKRRISTDTIWKDSSHKYMAQDLSEADSYHVANSEVIVHGGTSATAGNRRHKDYLHRLDAWCQGPIESILNIKVDPTCNYLEVDDNESSRVVLELVQDMIYEIDDLSIDKIEVTRLD